jgi:hypothetical protein
MIRTAASKARRQPPREGCPTPAKKAYATEDAIHKALRSSRFAGRPIRIYQCPCGHLHLTKRVPPRRVGISAPK